MANTFKNAVLNNTTTAATIYTVPSATTTIVTSLIIANDSGADTTVGVTFYKNVGATSINILNSAPLAAASNMSALSNNNRLVMMTGDYIQIAAGANVDSIISFMEIT